MEQEKLEFLKRTAANIRLGIQRRLMRRLRDTPAARFQSPIFWPTFILRR